MTEALNPCNKNTPNPLVKAGHEVMVWPCNDGVVALINLGSEGLKKTLQYAADGVHFSTMGHVGQCPYAAGFYRPEAFTDSQQGAMPLWRVEITQNKGQLPGLGYFEIEWSSD